MTGMLHSTGALGQALRTARRQQGLTQADLAARAGVTQATVSKIERDVAPPGFDTVLKLLSVLGLELWLQPKPDRLPAAPWEET